VALVGAPNAGKSRLLRALTNASPVVAPYPFSTRAPLPGMVPFEDIKIQLVDLPPIAAETAEPWLFAVIRQADGALLVADLDDDDLLAAMDRVMELTEQGRVEFARGRGQAGATPALLVATKSDAPDAGVRLELLREAYGARFEILPVSGETGEGLDGLREQLFRLLGVIRVYTKAPGRRADKSVPFVFRRGITVEEAAAVVHKDFAERLKYARVWGSRTFEGQMVQREHVLDDGDVLELHA
jgi:ribosome-interacting GTPase 1